MRYKSEGLALVIVLIVGFMAILLNYSPHKPVHIKYCRIDSITSKPRYEMMPELDYTYHTACGAIPAGHTNRKVGDSIEIEIIQIK